WRRWHISLSSWFKDYLYIPLGGSKGGTWMRIRNTFIIFIVSGFWHGANWTFIVWGVLNALYIMPSIISQTNRNNLETVAQGKMLPTPKEFFQMMLTFALTVFAWIFFRAESIENALSFVSGMFAKSLFVKPAIRPYSLISIVIIFMIVEWLGREEQYAIAKLGSKWNRTIRYAMYYTIIIAIFWFGGKEQQF